MESNLGGYKLMALENFPTYSPGETDPNSTLTITTNKIDIVGATRNVDAYHLDDKGVDHFDGDFEHLLETFTSSVTPTGGNTIHWLLANVINDRSDMLGNGDDFLELGRQDKKNMIIVEQDGASTYVDTFVGANDTLYYLAMERDEEVGTYGTFYSYVYTDSNRTVLVDTLSITLHGSKKDFRYYYALNSVNDGNSSTYTGYTQNHDLQEAVTVVGSLINKGLTNSGLTGGRICG
jgi:hypothetical protein